MRARNGQNCLLARESACRRLEGAPPSHLVRRVGTFLLVTTAYVATTAAQVPPGYEVLQLTTGPAMDHPPRMNNRGQIVWESRLTDTDESGEIFLYANGTITRLTNDNFRDALPDINDAGEIVWSRFIGPQGPYGLTPEIVHYRDGVLTQITFDGAEDYAPRINNLGLVVWKSSLDGSFLESDVYLLDGGTIVRLTNGLAENRSNQDPNINDRGQIVWTRYNDSVTPWESDIRLYEDGDTRTISAPNEFEPQLPEINDLGHIVWYHNNFTTSQQLRLWNGSKVLDLTYGRNPRINDRGDIYFIRWHDFGGWQAWLYHGKQFYQLSDDPFWNTDGNINNVGEAVWKSGETFTADIRFMSLRLGDLNCDGTNNGFDIEPFVLAISDATAYEAAYPDCDIALADINRDGSVDGVDVEPFVALLKE
ncbi:MAG: hypothetical protein CHACPFDD_01840 [Phycisphaerae bacterium]|nr:hypothetical protein [Phycisphaerae bacterium]